MYKALRNEFTTVLDELKRIEAGGSIDDELLDIIELMTATMNGMKEESE